MMDLTLLAARRRAMLKTYMEEKGLTSLLFLNPGCGNWNQWLADGTEQGHGAGLVLAPFNRNNLYIVPPEGPVVKRCAVTPHPTDAFLFPELNGEEVRDILGCGPVGVVNMEAMKKAVRDQLLAACPGLQLVDVTRDLDAIKAIKSQMELDAAQEAATIFDRGFTTVPMLLRDGKLERDVVINLRERLADLGVSAEDMSTLYALRLTSAPQDGPAAAEPMEYPGRRMTLGDRANILVNGYGLENFACALGRCYTLGPATEQTKKYWAMAVQAQALAAQNAKPGVTPRQLGRLVDEQILTPNGLGPDDSNWLYGLGDYRCEAPRIVDDTADMPLQAGMVLAIGPAIRPAGQDAYCCMDMFRVTENGAVRLTRTTQDLRELGTLRTQFQKEA